MPTPAGGRRPRVMPMAVYPTRPAERTRWILARRGTRVKVGPWRPAAFLLEQETSESGEQVQVATVFLANRECPWRCLMCDLWRHTLTESVPPGAIPVQIDYALERLQAGRTRGGQDARHLKLYNAGSFFDPRAISPADHPAIAARAASFELVVVESHPALVSDDAVRFRDLLLNAVVNGPPREQGPARLEVAMGLETAHPRVLAQLNKRMSLDRFARAAGFLRRNQIDVRVFVLVKPPFLDETQALDWAVRSVEFAFDCGATVVCLIPTRAGNGALEALAEQGQFAPPKLATLETALDQALALRRGRVFADLWDLERLADCPTCFERRATRLRDTNRLQRAQPGVACPVCSPHRGK